LSKKFRARCPLEPLIQPDRLHTGRVQDEGEQQDINLRWRTVEKSRRNIDTLAVLKTIFVGTGRDGTMSLNHMVECVFAASGGGRTMHEYCCREFYQAFCDYR